VHQSLVVPVLLALIPLARPKEPCAGYQRNTKRPRISPRPVAFVLLSSVVVGADTHAQAGNADADAATFIIASTLVLLTRRVVAVGVADDDAPVIAFTPVPTRAASVSNPRRGQFWRSSPWTNISSILGNNVWAHALSIIAITRPKEQPPHETPSSDRICCLHSCARSNGVCVRNAERKAKCTYRQWHFNYPSTWLGPSRWPWSSLWMGSRPSLWMGPSSSLVKHHFGIILKEAAWGRLFLCRES
jgi:hypothetical protein